MRAYLVLLAVLGGCTFGHDPGSPGDPYGYGDGSYYSETAVVEVEVRSFGPFRDRQLGTVGNYFLDGTDPHYAQLLASSPDVFMTLNFDPLALPSDEEMSTRLALTTADADETAPNTAQVSQPTYGALYFCPNDGSGSATIQAEIVREPSPEGLGWASFRVLTGSIDISGRFELPTSVLE